MIEGRKRRNNVKGNKIGKKKKECKINVSSLGKQLKQNISRSYQLSYQWNES